MNKIHHIPKRQRARLALALALLALLPNIANALPLEDSSSHAGLATLTVTRSGPNASATKSGSASEIAPNTTFVMAWTDADAGSAAPLASLAGAPSFAVDFGHLLNGRAPVSLGRYVFDLSQAPTGGKLEDIDLSGPSSGDVSGVLALAASAEGSASWSGSVRQGVFSATYQLFLFDVAAIPEDPTVTAVPEPSVLALIGIALTGLAASLHSRRT